jgi:hypothetical protein
MKVIRKGELVHYEAWDKYSFKFETGIVLEVADDNSRKIKLLKINGCVMWTLVLFCRKVRSV